MTSIIEADFVRLICSAEDLSSSGGAFESELLVMYEKLQQLLATLKAAKRRPAAEFLHIYSTRVRQLKAYIAITIRHNKLSTHTL